jgi:hypothetical protein
MGEKILKRCINYTRRYDADIDSADFLNLLLGWPGCRAELLRWWQHSMRPEGKLKELTKFVASDEIVDHHALIAVADALVSARLPSTPRTGRFLREICDCLDQRTGWGLYAKLWIASKYGSTRELMRIVESSVSIWITEEHLSRLVAGIYPRILDSRYLGKFKALVTKSGNPWCRSVLDFHIGLSTTVEGFSAIRKFLSAPNPTLPNKISHSKFLMLCSALKNPYLSTTQLDSLRVSH